MKYLITCILSLSIMSANLSAENLYVSVNGTGTSCSKDDPCASVQAAVTNAGAGDTIKVAAGTYKENIFIPPGKNGLTITGKGVQKTIIQSAGGRDSAFAPAGVPLDALFQIVSEEVTIEKMTVEHPAGNVVKRDVAFLVTPFAENTTIQKCEVVRSRTGELSFGPGSRGVLVFRAGGAVISKNNFRGAYQDHIHVPGHNMEIVKNKVADASRLGIVIIQENATSNNNDNIVAKNIVKNSGSDGIQIQSSNNIINKNIIENNAGAAIKLCGLEVIGDCINPFDGWSNSSANSVSKNKLDDNGMDIIDNGTNNTVN